MDLSFFFPERKEKKVNGKREREQRERKESEKEKKKREREGKKKEGSLSSPGAQRVVRVRDPGGEQRDDPRQAHRLRHEVA